MMRTSVLCPFFAASALGAAIPQEVEDMEAIAVGSADLGRNEGPSSIQQPTFTWRPAPIPQSWEPQVSAWRPTTLEKPGETPASWLTNVEPIEPPFAASILQPSFTWRPEQDIVPQRQAPRSTTLRAQQSPQQQQGGRTMTVTRTRTVTIIQGAAGPAPNGGRQPVRRPTATAQPAFAMPPAVEETQNENAGPADVEESEAGLIPQIPSGPQIWQARVGSRFQIILDRTAMTSARNSELIPENADVFDVDLFDTPASLIKHLHQRGKKVICYFSAGSSESWRPDFDQIKKKDLGDGLKGWQKEKWLDIRSLDVFEVMRKRILMAKEKGCDGIDPDNVDAFRDALGGGFPAKLSKDDTVTYLRKMADEAHRNGLAMGLKNAETIISSVQDSIEYAVNEECATYYGGCRPYESFLNSGKPVFHIEYARTKVNGTKFELVAEKEDLRAVDSSELKRLYCLEKGVGEQAWAQRGGAHSLFSTVIKALELNKWVMYCDGYSAGDIGDAALTE